MQLTAVGLNHHTAPLHIRERLAFAAGALPQALDALAASGAAREAVILSTCNRTELYCIGDAAAVTRWWADFHQLPLEEVAGHVYALSPEASIRHAFRVACGLDSMVLGEPQILGQLKDAVRTAAQQHTLHGGLQALFQRTFAVAKEVRTQTAVGAHSVSMAAAAVKMVEQIFPSIADLNILFVGAGEMIGLVATYFDAKTPRHITVLNRSPGRAEALCAALDSPARAAPLNELPAILRQCDVVVSSTASPVPIIGKGLVERAIRERRGMPVFLLDLAVPRDIEAEVGALDDAYLYTVDDMMGIVNSGKAARAEAAAAAEAVVQEKVAEFLNWQQARQAVPLIRALREDGDRARRQALDKARKHLARGMPPEEVLERLSVQLTNKLLHAPTRTLNQHSQSSPELADAIRRIYRLDPPPH